MKKIIICLFLSAGLSGCHVYRTYERPDTTVTDSLYPVSYTHLTLPTIA